MSNVSVTDAADMGYHDHMVQLGQGMTLQGYRLQPSVDANGNLTVETDWQAQQQLDGDYHYFVHVIGADGSVAAQYDTVPDNGQFPTSKWTPRQMWRQLDSIPVKGVPGIYGVYVGWYRYPDLTRLGVEGTASKAADGLVYLTDILVR